MRRMYSEKQVQEIIKKVIESGQVNNAKPIYCHPIYFKITLSNRTYSISCLIFNNEENAFADYKAFFNYISNLINNHNAIIMCSGGIGITSDRIIIATNIRKSVANTIAIHGISSLNYTEDYFTITENETVDAFVDGVNKIN